MATPIIESAFTTGEVAPALFGNVALQRMHSAAATMRNGFVGYQGGWYSRAGTEFVGFSKQTGRAYPPRMIPFQFSINQGLALEFGNFYMRVIFDGAYVTEAPFQITAATQASPCVLSLSSVSTALSAIPINSAVSSSYAPGDTIGIAGGVFTTRAVLQVGQTLLSSVAVSVPGDGYGPGEQITLAGGSAIVQPIVSIVTTKVSGVDGLVYAGSGGTPGAQVLTGTTGTGTKWQANVTVDGSGAISSINSIAVAGSYTANPAYSPTGYLTDQMTGGGFGAPFQPVIRVRMGVNTVSIINPGSFVANAPAGAFTQASTSGSGSGATFISGVFGIANLTISNAGAYTAVPANPVAQFNTSGTGVGATFTMSWSVPPSLTTGDWIFVDDIVGMTQLNGRTFVVSVAGPTISLFDIYGNPIDSSAYSAYVSGGTASRIFTLPTQYSEVDLKWLKFTESADVMSLCCVNQETGTEYPPVDLARFSDSSWTFTAAVPAPSVSPPASLSLSASPQPPSPTTQASYEYVVTSVAEDGTESIASPIGSITNQVNIIATSGTITLAWPSVAGVNEYLIYKASPGISAISGNAPLPPAGALFGYAGSAYGNQFLDTNIVADFTQVPPLHKNPFARGQVISVTPGAQGSGYTTATATINTFTGGGAVIQAVISGTAVVGYIVKDPGQNYAPTDTVTISGDGTGATATLRIGAQTGTYPGVVAYFQQRRFYAYTLNQPDTYFGSQPGAFTNFDTRVPPIDTDAITGNPWSVQVNGIQFMLAVSGGLVVLTGLEAYFLTGAGGSAFSPQPISPASQSAQPQGFNGCSPTVPPVRIYQDVLYVQAKGTTYRNFSFNISLNTYTGEDITQNSTQLFNGFQISEHAWCEEPARLLWARRNDGALLSLTWVKSEKVGGWARHDTDGTFESVCSVTEPPVDALYVATQRQIGDHTPYIVERMNNRLWSTIEDTWCVDCGLSYPQVTPDATLSASSPTGLGSLTGVTGLVGGSGYSAATTARVVDDNGEGPGSGAVAAVTVLGGIITAITFPTPGSGYVNPQLIIEDPAGSAGGSGASADPVLDNSATFTASAAVFVVGDVGRVLRVGGGVATITAFTDSQHVTANITTPITDLLPNRDPDTARVAASGDWTISTPITVVSGLWALVGATVTGLADGIAIPPQVVAADGTITLASPASQITIGLAFKPQLQSVYLDTGEPTTQGQRKKVAEVTARVQNSGPFKIGSNQPDGSVQSPIQIAPKWRDMADAPTPAVAPYNSSTVPLFTGDIRIPVQGGFQKTGQVAVEQDLPYPLEVLAFVPTVWLGDNPAQKAPERQGRR